jgi:hypothetical protein
VTGPIRPVRTSPAGGSSSGPPDVEQAAGNGGGRGRTALRVVLYLLAASGVGAVTGVLWWRVVDLPVYVVGPDGGATTTERGLTEYVSGDAWFSLIGFVVGAALGFAAWRFFRHAGWRVVPLVIVASLIAALICWYVGWELGPGPFPPRLGLAPPGSAVPIELTVRARSAVLVWPFAAVLVILLGSSIGRDDEEPRPILPNWRRRAARERADDRSGTDPADHRASTPATPGQSGRAVSDRPDRATPNR